MNLIMKKVPKYRQDEETKNVLFSAASNWVFCTGTKTFPEGGFFGALSQ